MIAIFKDKQTFYAVSALDRLSKFKLGKIFLMCYKVDTRIDDIQRSSSPKSKMVSSQSVETLVPHFGKKLNGEVCCGFFFANHFNSPYLWVRL